MIFSAIPFLTLASWALACNPLTQTCSPDPALGTCFSHTFDKDVGEYFTQLKNPGQFTFSSEDGMSMTMNKQGDNPSILSNFYIMFGKVEVVLKAAKGKGIISSFYLQSDDLDEIDIELFGGDNYEFQSNYFIKGNVKTYDRGLYVPTYQPLDQYHTYTIDWNQDQLTWSLDGKVVRTLGKDNAQGYPQSPMQIHAGIWAGGDPNNPEGTIEWAGGLTDFSQAPFTMNIKSIIVCDYSTGKSYSYSNRDGTWQSIKSDGGSINGNEDTANTDFSELQRGKSVDSKPLASLGSASATSADPSTSDSSTTKTSSSSATSSSSSSSTLTTSTSTSTSSSATASSASTSSSVTKSSSAEASSSVEPKSSVPSASQNSPTTLSLAPSSPKASSVENPSTQKTSDVVSSTNPTTSHQTTVTTGSASELSASSIPSSVISGNNANMLAGTSLSIVAILASYLLL